MKSPMLSKQTGITKGAFYVGYAPHRCSGDGCNDEQFWIQLWKTEYSWWPYKGMICPKKKPR